MKKIQAGSSQHCDGREGFGAHQGERRDQQVAEAHNKLCLGYDLTDLNAAGVLRALDPPTIWQEGLPPRREGGPASPGVGGGGEDQRGLTCPHDIMKQHRGISPAQRAPKGSCGWKPPSSRVRG